MVTYNITIENNSGSRQNYIIFNEAPKTKPEVHETSIWLSILKTQRADDRQNTGFSVSNTFRGLAGSANGRLTSGSDISNVSTVPVRLGSLSDDGRSTPGTTLGMTVRDGALQSSNDPRPNGAPAGSFEIVTDNSFEDNEARDRNYVIGHGIDISDGSAPASAFIPQPGQSYQIQPTNKFWVGTGNFERGTLIQSRDIETLASVDFSRSASTRATVQHNSSGRLTLRQ